MTLCGLAGLLAGHGVLVADFTMLPYYLDSMTALSAADASQHPGMRTMAPDHSLPKVRDPLNMAQTPLVKSGAKAATVGRPQGPSTLPSPPHRPNEERTPIVLNGAASSAGFTPDHTICFPTPDSHQTQRDDGLQSQTNQATATLMDLAKNISCGEERALEGRPIQAMADSLAYLYETFTRITQEVVRLGPQNRWAIEFHVEPSTDAATAEPADRVSRAFTCDDVPPSRISEMSEDELRQRLTEATAQLSFMRLRGASPVHSTDADPQRFDRQSHYQLLQCVNQLQAENQALRHRVNQLAHPCSTRSRSPAPLAVSAAGTSPPWGVFSPLHMDDLSNRARASDHGASETPVNGLALLADQVVAHCQPSSAKDSAQAPAHAKESRIGGTHPMSRVGRKQSSPRPQMSPKKSSQSLTHLFARCRGQSPTAQPLATQDSRRSSVDHAPEQGLVRSKTHSGSMLARLAGSAPGVWSEHQQLSPPLVPADNDSDTYGLVLKPMDTAEDRWSDTDTTSEMAGSPRDGVSDMDADQAPGHGMDRGTAATHPSMLRPPGRRGHASRTLRLAETWSDPNITQSATTAALTLRDGDKPKGHRPLSFSRHKRRSVVVLPHGTTAAKPRVSSNASNRALGVAPKRKHSTPKRPVKRGRLHSKPRHSASLTVRIPSVPKSYAPHNEAYQQSSDTSNPTPTAPAEALSELPPIAGDPTCPPIRTYTVESLLNASDCNASPELTHRRYPSVGATLEAPMQRLELDHPTPGDGSMVAPPLDTGEAHAYNPSSVIPPNSPSSRENRWRELVGRVTRKASEGRSATRSFEERLKSPIKRLTSGRTLAAGATADGEGDPATANGGTSLLSLLGLKKRSSLRSPSASKLVDSPTLPPPLPPPPPQHMPHQNHENATRTFGNAPTALASPLATGLYLSPSTVTSPTIVSPLSPISPYGGPIAVPSSMGYNALSATVNHPLNCAMTAGPASNATPGGGAVRPIPSDPNSRYYRQATASRMAPFISTSRFGIPYRPVKRRRAVYSKWTAAEDVLLRVAVCKYREKNWDSIAKEVPGRNYHQCRQRWNKSLSLKHKLTETELKTGELDEKLDVESALAEVQTMRRKAEAEGPGSDGEDALDPNALYAASFKGPIPVGYHPGGPGGPMFSHAATGTIPPGRTMALNAAGYPLPSHLPHDGYGIPHYGGSRRLSLSNHPTTTIAAVPLGRLPQYGPLHAMATASTPNVLHYPSPNHVSASSSTSSLLSTTQPSPETPYAPYSPFVRPVDDGTMRGVGIGESMTKSTIYPGTSSAGPLPYLDDPQRLPFANPPATWATQSATCLPSVHATVRGASFSEAPNHDERMTVGAVPSSAHHTEERPSSGYRRHLQRVTDRIGRIVHGNAISDFATTGKPLRTSQSLIVYELYLEDPLVADEAKQEFCHLLQTNPSKATAVIQPYVAKQQAFRRAHSLPKAMTQGVPALVTVKQARALLKLLSTDMNVFVLNFINDPSYFVVLHNTPWYQNFARAVANGLAGRIQNLEIEPAAVHFGFGGLINQNHAMHLPELVGQWLAIIFTLDMAKVMRQDRHNPSFNFWTQGIGKIDQHLISAYLEEVMALHTIPTAIAMYVWYGNLVEVERFIDRLLENHTLVNFLRDNGYTGFYYEFAAFTALFLGLPRASDFVAQLLTKPGFRADRIYECNVASWDQRPIQNAIINALGRAPAITVTDRECTVFRNAAKRSVIFGMHNSLCIKSWVVTD
ncbi:hypothetical protein H4R35_000301 [Dimargaris xerosporica]|nr:hypothetical protein H4R35_000301 [Dimargaris xerosporica]